MVSRRDFLRPTPALPLLPGLAAQSGRRPNVVLVITDDQGYGDLSIHGNPHLQTPNIDAIGQQGVQFTQFHVCTVCSPTRSSLMTGRYHYRTGIVDTAYGRSMMFPDEVTLPQLLSNAGYRTGIFGKWHLGDCYPMRCVDRGFQESLVHGGGGITQGGDAPGNTYFDPVLLHNARPVKTKGYCTDIFTDAALQFIEVNRERPFFTYLATNAPHGPLQVDASWSDPFLHKGLSEAAAKTYGMVANIDKNVGRLMAKLKELNLERDTILIFMTDNGPGFARYNAGMRGTKGTQYEGGIRVPFFLRWPAAVEAGRQTNQLAAHLDILPTLLDACGVLLPKDLALDGRSLLPLLRGAAPHWPDRRICFQWHPGDTPERYRNCAVRNQRYKMVNGKELYDLEADPAETKDIAASHSAMLADFRKYYDGWFDEMRTAHQFQAPKIVIGTPRENPTTLTRQDFRGSNMGWEPEASGHWEVDIKPGDYAVSLQLFPAPDSGVVRLMLNEFQLETPIVKGATVCRFERVRLDGAGRFTADVLVGWKKYAARYVELHRL